MIWPQSVCLKIGWNCFSTQITWAFFWLAIKYRRNVWRPWIRNVVRRISIAFCPIAYDIVVLFLSRFVLGNENRQSKVIDIFQSRKISNFQVLAFHIIDSPAATFRHNIELHRILSSFNAIADATENARLHVFRCFWREMSMRQLAIVECEHFVKSGQSKTALQSNKLRIWS